MSHESTAAALTIAHELDAHPSGRGIGRLAADLADAPLTAESAWDHLKFWSGAEWVMISGDQPIAFGHKTMQARGSEWRVNMESKDKAVVVGEKAATLAEVVTRAMEMWTLRNKQIVREQDVRKRIERELAEADAAEKSLAAHVGPQHPEEPVTHTSEATAQDFAGIAVPADAHRNGKVQQ